MMLKTHSNFFQVQDPYSVSYTNTSDRLMLLKYVPTTSLGYTESPQFKKVIIARFFQFMTTLLPAIKNNMYS